MYKRLVKNIHKKNYPKKHRDIETKRLLLLKDNLISLRGRGSRKTRVVSKRRQ